jgi:hypothetical protein
VPIAAVAVRIRRRRLARKNRLETQAKPLKSTPDMKSNPLGPFLVGVFVACALVVAWLSLKYFFSMREFAKLNIRAVSINNTRTAVQSLANEAAEYSRRNPAIDPLLERFDVKPRGTNAAPAAPGTPPSSK